VPDHRSSDSDHRECRAAPVPECSRHCCSRQIDVTKRLDDTRLCLQAHVRRARLIGKLSPANPDHQGIRDEPSRAFDALRMRKGLNALEPTRCHLALLAGPQRSHGVDDAKETFNLQLGVESTIRDESPTSTRTSSRVRVERQTPAEHSAVCRHRRDRHLPPSRRPPD
jgi:hypothetical protein